MIAPASQVVYQVFPAAYGGLEGVTEHLDHLAGLGVTTVYLTPIVPAPTDHRYDATDLFAVDPAFGGEPALERLLAGLHGRGMNLVLDLVLNHVSDRHPWFRAALAGDPAFRGFFTFLPDGRYQCWKGFRGMPELNLAEGAVLDRLYRGPGSVVERWLDLGVDGLRFDVAQDVGLAVAEDLAARVRERWPRCLLIGEVFGYGGGWCRGFHGTMNYYLLNALLSWLNGEIGAVQANRAVGDVREGWGLDGALRSWNMLSSHDTPRLRSALADAGSIDLAQLAQMTLPGVPLVYYGEEVGMEGGADPDNRRPMVWDAARWDRGRLAWTRKLIALRQGSPELMSGDVKVLGDRLPGNALAFLRYTEQPGEAALVVINASTDPLRAKLLIPYPHWPDGVPLRDALGQASELTVRASSVALEIAPRSGAVYRAVEPLETYRYFKPRNRA